MSGHLMLPADAADVLAAIEQIQQMLYESAEAKIAALFWLVGLNAFALGIAIITIFAILWVKN